MTDESLTLPTLPAKGQPYTLRYKRGTAKPCFRWKERGSARYEIIKSPTDRKAVERQFAALMVKLTTGEKPEPKAGPKRASRSKALIEPNLVDYIASKVPPKPPEPKTEEEKRKRAEEAKKRKEPQYVLIEKRIRRILVAGNFVHLVDLTTERVEQVVNAMRQASAHGRKDDLKIGEREGAKPLSEQTRLHYCCAIKGFAIWLKQAGRTRTLLLDGLVTKAKVEDQPNARDRLQPDEVDRLLASTITSAKTFYGYDGKLRAWLYRLGLATGLRRGELASLTRENFRTDGDGGMTVIVKALDTKGGRKAEQPIPPALVADLKAWLATVDGPLFPKLKEVKPSVMIEKDLKAAGIAHKSFEGVRCFHSLRNTYISSLWDANVPAPVVQDLARHTDIKLTMKYARHLKGAKRDAVNRIGFGAAPKSNLPS